MFCLMGLLPAGRAVPNRYDDQLRGRIEIPDSFYREYPPDLINLLLQCLEPIPDRRIDCDDLLRDITRIVQDYPRDFGSVPMKFESLPKESPLWTKRDMYELMSRY